MSRDVDRQQIRRDLAEYRKRGAKVKRVPPGVSGVRPQKLRGIVIGRIKAAEPSR